jgi:hypothetical protein
MTMASLSVRAEPAGHGSAQAHQVRRSQPGQHVEVRLPEFASSPELGERALLDPSRLSATLLFAESHRSSSRRIPRNIW